MIVIEIEDPKFDEEETKKFPQGCWRQIYYSYTGNYRIMRYFIPIFVIITVSVVSIMGFRGSFTENTPLEVFPDMDRQAKFKKPNKKLFFF